jgi:hypothetical protein
MRWRAAVLPVSGALVLATALLLRRHHAPSDSLGVPRPAGATSDAAASCLRVRRIPRSETWRWSAVDVTVELERCTLDVTRAADGDRLERLLPPGALAAFNGGYFEADYRPTAWLRVHGQDWSPAHRTNAGGVLALKATSAYVGPLAGLPFDPELGIQNGPLLVEADGAVGIHVDDGKRAARTVVCASGGALRLVLVPADPGDGPTLLELARWLVSVAACSVALNLDGGPSTGVIFAPELGESSSPPRARIGYAIVVVPRTA